MASALIAFSADCPLGNCKVVSFISSCVLAATAIFCRSGLVTWYESHKPRVWLVVTGLLASSVSLGFPLCDPQQASHPCSKGIVTISRPLGCLVGLLLCDKLDKNAHLRTHICGRGLLPLSWVATSLIASSFVLADNKLTAQRRIVSSVAIPALGAVHILITCRFVVLVDLWLMKYRNNKFIDKLADQIPLRERPRQRIFPKTANNPCAPGQAGRSGSNRIPSDPQKPEVADVTRNTSTIRVSEGMTRRFTKGTDSTTKVMERRVLHTTSRGCCYELPNIGE